MSFISNLIHLRKSNPMTTYRGVKYTAAKPFPLRRQPKVLVYRGIEYLSK